MTSFVLLPNLAYHAGENFQQTTLWNIYIFFYFYQKIGFYFSCKLETICIKCEILLSDKKVKKNVKLSSAEFAESGKSCIWLFRAKLVMRLPSAAHNFNMSYVTREYERNYVLRYVNCTWHRRSAQYARTHVRNMRKKLFYDKVALT